MKKTNLKNAALLTASVAGIAGVTGWWLINRPCTLMKLR